MSLVVFVSKITFALFLFVTRLLRILTSRAVQARVHQVSFSYCEKEEEAQVLKLVQLHTFPHQ